MPSAGLDVLVYVTSAVFDQHDSRDSLYSRVHNFANGYAPIARDYKWGFIDEKGNLIIKNKKVFCEGKTPSPSASDIVTSLRTSVFPRGAFLFTRESLFPSKQKTPPPIRTKFNSRYHLNLFVFHNTNLNKYHIL